MGTSFSGIRVSVQVLICVALTVMLFAAARYVPVTGLLVSLLAPTPILLVTLREGLYTGLSVLGLSTLGLALWFGHLPSGLFLAEYGVMAVVLAGAIRRRWPMERAILAATALPVVASGALIGLLLSSIDFDLGALQQHLEEDLGQALRPLLSEAGAPSDAELRGYVQEVFATVVRLFPALFVLSTAAGVLLNYAVVCMLWRRLGSGLPLPEMKLARWKAPEVCVWVLIAGGLGSFVPLPAVQMVGLNVLLLVSVVYLAQGIGVMAFYLNRASVPLLLRGLAYLVLLIQPLFLLGVAACGLFDLWFDFRRIGNQPEETP
jgi:uncharacterized protein YybS (DUF2232 family)